MSDENQGTPDVPPSPGPGPEPGPTAASPGPPPPPPGPGAGAPPPGNAHPPPPTGGGSGQSGAGGENRTLWLVLSYLGPLALIPFFVEKNDAEVQWHAKNGILFTAANVLVGIAGNMVFSMLACFGCLPAAVLFVVQLGVHVMGIVKALGGERFRIPGLSDYADRPWG